MKFIDLYEADNADTTRNSSETTKNKEDSKNSNEKEVLSSKEFIKIVVSAMADSKSALEFFNHLTCLANKSGLHYSKDNKVYDLYYTKDKSTTNDIKIISKEIKSKYPNSYEKTINTAIQSLDGDSKRTNLKDSLQKHFLGYITNPERLINSTGTEQKKSVHIGGEQDYEKFGKAMVFYSSKAISAFTAEDTKIDEKAFKEIIQGVFGAVSEGSNKEPETVLNQFTTIGPKMKIDAAKHVIQDRTNVDNKNTDESYYSGLSYIINNNLNEAVKSGNDITIPKNISDFSTNVGVALKQAAEIANAYPNQYKIWYERLQKAFDKGLKEQQALEKKTYEEGKNEFVNPLTGKIEKRAGKGLGAGGPNAFIRSNPTLNKIVERIKKGDPNAQPSGGWTIFNAGPKLILKIFDLIEGGGKALQRFIDDIDENVKKISRALSTLSDSEWKKMIKKAHDNQDYADMIGTGTAWIITDLSNLYNLLSDGPILDIDASKHTVNTIQDNNKVNIQARVDSLIESIELFINEEYTKYESSADEIKKQAENEKIKIKNNIQKDSSNDEDDEEEEDSTPIIGASYKPRRLNDFINEDETTDRKTNKNKADSADADKLIKQVDEKVDKKLQIKLDQFSAVLNAYSSTQDSINKINDISKELNEKIMPDDMFNDYQKYQEGEFNPNSNDEDEEDNESNNIKDSYAIKLSNKKLFEADEPELNNTKDTNNNQSSDNTTQSSTTEEKEKDNNKEEKEEDLIAVYDNNIIESYTSFKQLYKDFGDGTTFKLNLHLVNELANAKTVKTGLEQLKKIFESMLNALKKCKINEINNGFTIISNEDAKSLSDSYNVNYEETTEETVEEKDDKNDKDDKDNDASDEQGDNLKSLEEYRKDLVELKEKIFTDHIEKLNEHVKLCKDDTWIDKYEELRKNLITITTKDLNDKLYEIYGDQIGQFMHEQVKFFKEGHYLVNLWRAASLIKYVDAKLNEQIKNEENKKESDKKEEDKKKQESVRPIFMEPFIYEQYMNENDENQDVNQNNNEQPDSTPVSVSINTGIKLLDKMDFNNQLLPADINSQMYNLIDTSIFNNTEKEIAERYLGTRADKNALLNITRHVVDYDGMKEKLKNCDRLIESIEGEMSIGTKQAERDIYAKYAACFAILNQLKAAASEIEANTNTKEKRGLSQGEISNTGVADGTHTPDNVDGNQSNQDNENNMNNSYHYPDVSSDCFLNEIYKYIRG